MMPILTIAIPTYNRCKIIKRTLHQLSKEKNQSFRIIVSDNDSSDNTETMIKKYQESISNLDYSKNKKNIGYSGNILKLYDLAKTRYIWFLSDDETVLPGSIDKILDALATYKPVVALFNHIRVDPYGRKLVDGVEKNVIYNNLNKLTDYTSLLRTCFMSVVVVEKRLPLNVIRRVYDESNIYFQLSLSLLLLSDKFKFCEIAKPVVFRNATYESGEFFKFLLTDWLKAAFIVDSKFDNKEFLKCAKKRIFSALQLYLSQKMGMYKYNGGPTWETIKRIIKYYGFSSIFISFFPILYYLTPTFLLKFLYRSQLSRIHGKKLGLKIYNMNLNRVLRVERSSGFIDSR